MGRAMCIVMMVVLACAFCGRTAWGGAPAEPPLPDLPKTQVTIPWSELRALLGQAAPAAPPVDFVLSQAAYAATVEGDRARVTASAEVNALGPQWTLVPLGPAAAGIVSAKADDQPCQLVLRDKALYALFAGQRKHKLELLIERRVVEAKEGRQFDLSPLPCAVSSLTATLPGAALAVESEGAVAPQSVEKGNTTVFTATYPAAPTITVAWRPRPPVARPPRLYAESETLAVVDDGLIRVEARVATQIVHTAAKELHFRLDPKAIVLGVAGKNVANWAEEAAQDAKGVAVTLAQPALGTQEAEITYELEFPADGGDVALGAVRLEGALRDQGCLAVASTGAVQVEPGKTDVPRIGVSELPERIRKARADSLQLAYRFTKPPAVVRLALTRPKPQPA